MIVRGTRRYFYKSLRVGGRATQRYLGAGERADQAAAEEERRRQERRARREAALAEEAGRRQADGRLEEFIRLTDAVARISLMAAGYFRHDRGELRRRAMMTTATTNATQPPADPAGPAAPAPLAGELQDLVRRAEAGDLSVLNDLQRVLRARPELSDSYRTLGDMVELAWLRLAAGDDVMKLGIWQRQLDNVKAEVAGEVASPLVKLLAQRVGACWLQAQVADLAARVPNPAALAEAALVRRQNAAHRRLMLALKTLAVVQKLLKPAVSPVQIASRLETAEAVGLRRTVAPADAAGVLN
jgi:hypothetical protein